jgi:hypothetical protein
MNRTEFEARSQTGRNAYLYREALTNDYVDFSLEVRSSGMFYARPLGRGREAQLRCYLCESLLTALEHADPVIRIRAACQAFAYAGRLEGMGITPGSRHCDALLEVRNMLEAQIKVA